jgi:hypothetical protein
MQAPWGRIQIPVIDGGDVYLGATGHRDYGTIPSSAPFCYTGLMEPVRRPWG